LRRHGGSSRNGAIASTIQHLRFPFSWFLLPIFLVALVVVGDFDAGTASAVFVILHVLVYPASNGLNSFFDRDTESIGALRRPPPVAPGLLWVSLIMDVVALVAACFVGWVFALGVLVYGTASKAYSHPSIRIKKHPIAGWLLTGAGQGTFTALMVAQAVHVGSSESMVSAQVWIPAVLVGIFLLGFYPLTQVYQHQADAARGDRTMSMLVGVRGTFLLAVVGFLVSGPGLACYLLWLHGPVVACVFLLLMAPAGAYLLHWQRLVARNPSMADFGHATRMSILASSGINVFCSGLLVYR
jgi:1,4-dihydroxy-2-naphthoate octaprenyltransferase